MVLNVWWPSFECKYIIKQKLEYGHNELECAFELCTELTLIVHYFNFVWPSLNYALHGSDYALIQTTFEEGVLGNSLDPPMAGLQLTVGN